MSRPIVSLADEIGGMLSRLRNLLDTVISQELRGKCNVACDALDILHSKLIESRPRFMLPSGTREDYEQDVSMAKLAYELDKSSKNHDDWIAAQDALRRHYPETNTTT